MRTPTCLVMFAVGLAAVLATHGPARSDPPVAALVIPGNGAGYDPHARLLAEIRDELKGVREELRLMRAGAPVKPGADRRLAREQALLRHCAGCHTPARAEDGKDGGLILFADDEGKSLKPFSGKEWGDIADRVKRGDMPPKPRPPVPPKERELFE